MKNLFGCLFGHKWSLVKSGKIVATYGSIFKNMCGDHPGIGQLWKCSKCGKEKGQFHSAHGIEEINAVYLRDVVFGE